MRRFAPLWVAIATFTASVFAAGAFLRGQVDAFFFFGALALIAILIICLIQDGGE